MLVVRVETIPVKQFKNFLDYRFIVDDLPLSKCLEHGIVPLAPLFNDEMKKFIGCDFLDFKYHSYNLPGTSNQCLTSRTNWQPYQKTANYKNLEAYGNLTVKSISDIIKKSAIGHISLASMHRAISDVNLSIIKLNDNANINDITEYLKYRMDIDWSNQFIIQLLCAREGVEQSFSAARLAIYNAKPELKGTIKSTSVLETMDLTTIFSKEEFENDLDSLVGSTMPIACIFDHEMRTRLFYNLEGKTYLRVQNSPKISDGYFDLSTLCINKDWIIRSITESQNFELFPYNISDTTVEKKLQMLSHCIGKKLDNLPIQVRGSELEQLFNESVFLSFNGSYEHLPELMCVKLCSTIEANNIYSVEPPVSWRDKNVTEIKEILRSHGVSLTGNKDTLLDRLAKTFATKYEKFDQDINKYMQSFKGITMPNTNPGAVHKKLINTLSKDVSIYYDDITLRHLLYMYMKMHTYSDTIFNPDYTDSLYSAEGFSKHLIESGNYPQCLLLTKVI